MKEIDTIVDATVERLESGDYMLKLTTEGGHVIVHVVDNLTDIRKVVDELVEKSYKYNN